MTTLAKAERAAARGTERRAYPVALQVTRSAAAAGPTKLEGYASVTERAYDMYDSYGPYAEVVRSGAFAKTLAETPAVQLLLNHGGLSMAYTKAGSLRLSEDSTGLHMAAEVNPARGDVRDMLTALEDGDVDEMSFAFRVTRQQWSPDYDQRDITEVDLHRGDVSVVNQGANPATSVQAFRALDLDRMDDAGARSLLERLQHRVAAPAARGQAIVAALREGRSVAPGDVALIAQALGQFAAIDTIVDAAQEQLSAALGVPNPDLDDTDDMQANGARLPADVARARASILALR